MKHLKLFFVVVIFSTSAISEEEAPPIEPTLKTDDPTVPKLTKAQKEALVTNLAAKLGGFVDGFEKILKESEEAAAKKKAEKVVTKPKKPLIKKNLTKEEEEKIMAQITEQMAEAFKGFGKIMENKVEIEKRIDEALKESEKAKAEKENLLKDQETTPETQPQESISSYIPEQGLEETTDDLEAEWDDEEDYYDEPKECYAESLVDILYSHGEL